MRVSLKETRGGVDVFSLDDDVAAERVLRVAYAVFGHSLCLADHAARVGKRRGVLALPIQPLFQTSIIDRVLLGFRQQAEARARKRGMAFVP